MKKLKLISMSLVFLAAAYANADGFSFIQGPTLIESSVTQTTAGGTTAMTYQDETNQQFTGTLAETVILPSALSLKNGRRFNFLNRSTGFLTVQDFAAAPLAVIPPGSELTFLLIARVSAAGTWDIQSIPSMNGLSEVSQSFATGTAGTDFAISSSGSTHTFDLPTASAANTGKLSATDWSTFNGKQNALTIGDLSGTANRLSVSGGTGAIIGSGASVDIDSTLLPSPSGGDTGKALIATGADSATWQTVPPSGETNLAANVGTGAGLIFRDKTGVTLNLKTIKAGTNVTVTNNADDITIDSSGGGSATGARVPVVWEMSSTVGTPPPLVVQWGFEMFEFLATISGTLGGKVVVPASYTAGTQIQLSLIFASTCVSPSTAGFNAITYLVKPETHPADDLTNYHINAGSTTCPALSRTPKTQLKNLTDASGLINSVSVAAGDLLKFQLTRTGSFDLYLMRNLSEVVFQ